ncbi:RNA polymerase sigma factor [Ulvibacterium marinum]|uniref:RNA polymerase sigma factor n=1 Tax=Ulvibacterium marinum TaxID=2419782 RepID=UPI0024942113|nr:sigma-70 family RNA polymerase sigma factor [Ulvibacterium marinum]
MTYDNEKTLLEDLKNGEERAFIFLVDRFNQRLFGYALTLTNDYGMAEDIIQNVFFATWKKRKSLFIQSSLQNYLLKSVYNEFVTQYKKHRSTMVLESKYFEGLEKVTQGYDEVSLEKALQLIKVEIQNLPPKCREVFLLSRQEGLTNLEIAEYLNISIKTVEAQITKSFKIIRKNVGGKIKTVLLLLLGFGHYNNTPTLFQK